MMSKFQMSIRISAISKITYWIFRLILNILCSSDDLPEKEIEIKLEISKKAGLLRKPVKFVDSPGKKVT